MACAERCLELRYCIERSERAPPGLLEWQSLRLKGLLDLFLDLVASHPPGNDLAVGADQNKRGDGPDAEFGGDRALNSGAQESLSPRQLPLLLEGFLGSSIFSSTLRLRIAKFLSLPNASWTAWSWGISAMHGPHQVAQKSSSTYLPLKSARVIDLPSSVVASIDGATAPGPSAVLVNDDIASGSAGDFE